MNRESGMNAGQVIGTVAGQQVFGLDIAKSVFQVHTVDMGSGEIVNQQLRRAKVLPCFANRTPCLIGIEACGGAHHWARKLTAQGHSVRLIHAKAVRPFVGGNKTDAADARAIWLAIQQPGTKFVGVKTLEQQAPLVLHRQRELRMKMKAMQWETRINSQAVACEGRWFVACFRPGYGVPIGSGRWSALPGRLLPASCPVPRTGHRDMLLWRRRWPAQAQEYGFRGRG
jgi:hypothetical protein